ncbi:hypothetical protein [Streptomyces sp. NPDC053048]|uniref:hypothetical protein n=1 Tax=Streptomyces sp. NPDC053048 TaxID=3365694 RepID=UPI0037D13571
MVGAGLAAVVLFNFFSGEEIAKDEFEKLDNKEFEVVYEVIGTNVKDLDYGIGDNKRESSETVENPKLPWKKKVTMKGIATAPSLSLILGEGDGRADCVITINGKEVKRATAKGEFGTATCVAASPAGHAS